MTETIPFSKLREQSEDTFELVVAASKRSVQINNLRAAKYPLPTLTEDQEETFEETPEEEESINWDKMDKPVTAAVNEMLAGKVNYHYTEEIKETTAEEIDLDFQE
ncbi:MAG: DNA-directed RNA polymerase subunit omega [Candidatus Marinimicrobia bacterium CG08_land_8_20_14_0_20_45_22]|nr:MAG: DNA-directed RNA polymerase subunit omega [Candidatus Marinimicrobia bacterium CG08_land_8_20_14_0_20_45_22]